MGLKKPRNFVVEVGSVQRVRGPNFPTKTTSMSIRPEASLAASLHREALRMLHGFFKKFRGILTMGVYINFHRSLVFWDVYSTKSEGCNEQINAEVESRPKFTLPKLHFAPPRPPKRKSDHRIFFLKHPFSGANSFALFRRCTKKTQKLRKVFFLCTLR